MATPPITANALSPAPPKGPSPARPFKGLTKELSNLLKLDERPITPPPNGSEKEVSPKKWLSPGASAKSYLPGQPRIRLDPSGAADPNQAELLNYLNKSLLTKELDGILPFMKYVFVQTPSYRHIMPLHHQKAHARDVVVNELPGLHLVWYYDRIFIKPIPAYFYSQAFWDFLGETAPEAYKAAVGFMRSYYYLIQYEIDFEQACKESLIPKKPDDKHPTYEEYCEFIAPFKDVDDEFVCRRYHYGELRLTRINKAATLAKGHLAYFHIYPQWGSVLTHILAPVITVFAVSSVVLNSMQVALQAQQTDTTDSNNAWIAFQGASIWFPVVVICLIAAILGLGILGLIVMGVKDLIWAKTVRQKKKNGDREAGEKSHGLIW
ncbi:hypothetical protein GQ53DRAFT_680186 [Thozetella sp. PMI_491]|nr:hypothetical protein GQ53DRAFT_680186 [Thozetella sp. PMI_491]